MSGAVSDESGKRKPTATETNTNTDTTPTTTSTRASLATADSGNAWERFYKTHAGKGDGKKTISVYKDRHYLRKEFTELMPRAVLEDPGAWPLAIDPEATRPPDENSIDYKLVLELGCGVGNSAFPLLRANLDLRLICVDCSPTAISALTQNPEFDGRRCRAFVADVAGSNPCGNGALSVAQIGSENGIADESIDAVTCVFFFSALDENAFARVAIECARVLKKRGVLLFRDYAKADVKNNGSFSPGQELDPSVFVRPDGTLAVFVDEAFVASTFANVALVGTTEIVTHTVTNRKLNVSLDRYFVQGRFVKQ